MTKTFSPAVYLLVISVAVTFLFALYSPEVGLRPESDGLSVRDMTGQIVRLEGPAQSVMIFAPVAWHYLTVAGSDRHVTGLAPYFKNEAERTLLGRLFPGLISKNEALTSVGAVPLSVEQVLLERPDAVLTWSWFAGGYDIVKYPGTVRLDNAGTPLLYKTLGDVTDRKQIAFDLYNRYDEIIDKYSNLIVNRTKKINIIIIGNDDLFLWSRSFKEVNSMLNKLNAVNLAEKINLPKGSINIETILNLNPDAIFLGVFTRDLTVRSFSERPEFKGLRAVRSKCVYRVPKGASRLEGPVEEPLLFSWILQLIHPEIAVHPPLREQIRAAYMDAYGYVLSEDEIDEFLQMAQNGGAKFYGKFKRHN